MNYHIIHGVDLVNVPAMAFKVLEQNQGFFEKLFTPTEISYCWKKKGHTNQALSFAARLAAKGAVGKILGASYDVIGPKNIEVVNDDLGKPSIKLYDKATELALKMGVSEENIALSISHTDELIIASAVALIKKVKEAKKMEKTKKTGKVGIVKVVDEIAAENARVPARNIQGLFEALSKEAGLIPEFKHESADYSGNYLVVTLRIDKLQGRTVPRTAIARFTAREEIILTLPSSITIQFHSAFRDRLDSFVAATKKTAKDFGVDIEIRIVKNL